MIELKSSLVTLEEMLEARERRVRTQRELIQEFKQPLICFTMNIAGPMKTFEEAEQAFDEGKAMLKRQLHHSNCKVVTQFDYREKTGYEAYFVTEGNPYQLKQLSILTEEATSLGRIFDIDILSADGTKISREDVGQQPRKCLICPNPAHECSRSRAHTVQELVSQTKYIIRSYFEQKYARWVAQCATRGLLYEVCTTPKPGLVDRNNSGAHNDMDIFTFIDSSVALQPYFADIVLEGLRFQSNELIDLFSRIRFIGQQAEDAMFAATNSINTHKGLVYSIGLICAAAGFCYHQGRGGNTYQILDTCSKMVTDSVEEDFSKVTEGNCRTFGEKLYLRYGIKGIRGEAQSGFASVRDIGLPTLTELYNTGLSLNEAGCCTLLKLMVNVQDSNMIKRCGMETQLEIRTYLRHMLDDGLGTDEVPAVLRCMDDYFIKEGFSPGGCADLLAISYMLFFMQQEQHVD